MGSWWLVQVDPPENKGLCLLCCWTADMPFSDAQVRTLKAAHCRHVIADGSLQTGHCRRVIADRANLSGIPLKALWRKGVSTADDVNYTSFEYRSRRWDARLLSDRPSQALFVSRYL